MKLAKALKEKNALAKEVEVYFKRAAKNNSVLEGREASYSSKSQLKLGIEKVEKLVELKAKIHRANQPVQHKIFKISELKSIISRLRAIPTLDGAREPDYRQDQVLHYSAEIKEVEVDVMIDEYEKEIESIQEELDAFNHTTNI